MILMEMLVEMLTKMPVEMGDAGDAVGVDAGEDG